MGSRVMHAIVALEVARRRKETDLSTFFAGALAPSAASTLREKEALHFYDRHGGEDTKFISFSSFAKRYMDISRHPELKGYATHLVTDHIWLTHLYHPWLRNQTSKISELTDMYHRDFTRLNQPLLHHFALSESLNDVLKQPILTIFSHIDELQMQLTYQRLEEDLHREDDTQLEVLSWEGMLDYIHVSIEQSIAYLQGL
ncbi:hypothetical protein G4V62_09930 [Bacillaceae bacterium SIJ1]|uniref:hypothetical protein n=1 Tax=Litoribacterium kuwaitense TaxID=1398745 RepID=UPI0013EC60F6|nr:hypothetical protein [Litoribacterium kuwaitense]NGP45256.1 hypothetical protein [Litoribacterium kuwaitense]